MKKLEDRPLQLWCASYCVLDADATCELIGTKSHTRLPVCTKKSIDGTVNLLFASRSLDTGLERIYQARISLVDPSQEILNCDLVLDYSPDLGAFDDNGVCPCSIITQKGVEYLYYCGWNIRKKVPFSCAIGLATRSEGKVLFQRKFDGPVLDRNIHDSIFVAVNDVILHNTNEYETLYLSCKRWEADSSQKQGLKHIYAIKSARSSDGIHWHTDKSFSIDIENEYEYAISTPRYISIRSFDYCFYSYRGHSDGNFYKIGTAVRKHSMQKWARVDSITSCITIAGQDEPREVCYPMPVIFGNRLYLLHNGHGYGEKGVWCTSINIDSLLNETIRIIGLEE